MDNKESTYTLYGLSSSENPDKILYIGYTKKTKEKRLIEHLSESRKRNKTKKTKWINSVFNRGFIIVVQELDTETTIENIKLKEIEYIKMFKSFGASLKNGTNGGDGAVGNKNTENIILFNKEHHSKTMYIFNYKTGEFIQEYKNISQYCRDNKLTRNGVIDVLIGKTSNHKGLYFSYTKEFKKRERIKTPPWNKGLKTKEAQKFNTTSVIFYNEVEEIKFTSVIEACLHFNTYRKKLYKSINSNILFNNEYFVKYEDESKSRKKNKLKNKI